MGLSLETFASRMNISPMPLRRIQTGGSSPSVVLLSELASQLNKSILSFLEEVKAQNLPVHIKGNNKLSRSSSMMKIKVIGPRKMIADNIVVTAGELRKGKTGIQ